MTTATTIGQKLWNYCDVLRNAGLSYGDYLEQLTYLIFLKMMHERTSRRYRCWRIRRRRPFPRAATGPACWPGTARNWTSITATSWKPCPASGARWA